MGPYTREEFARKLGADGDPKLNAAADFAARLLNGPIGVRVARIVLFGSVVYGGATPDSDVDVMVFADAPPRQLSAAAAAAAWEATVETGELVAPLTYPLGRLLYRRPYVVYDTLKRGREIYGMDEKTERRQEARGLLRKARRLLAQASDNLTRRQYEASIVMSYTTAENAAKGLLLLKPGVDLPSTHGGVVQVFSREYIRTQEVPVEWAGQLHQRLELRTRSLYDYDSDPTESDAKDTLEFAAQIVEFLQKKLDAEVEE